MNRHQNISAEELGLTQEQYLEILNCPDVYQQVIEQFLQTKVGEENKHDDEEEKIDAGEFRHVKRGDEHIYYPHKINDKNAQDHPLSGLNLPLHQRLNNLRRNNIKLGADQIHKEALRRQNRARGILSEERPKREHKRYNEPIENQVLEKKSQQKSLQKEKIPGRSAQLRHKRPIRDRGAMEEIFDNDQESSEIEVEEVPVVLQEKSEERKIPETIFPQEKPENINKIPEFTEYMTKKPEQSEKPAIIPKHRFDISHPKMASHQRQQRRQRQIEERSGSKCNIF